LLREPLAFSKLRNANTLLEKLEGIKTLDGPNYDRGAKTVTDGALIVTGERYLAEVTSGLGGTFTYSTPGEPIEIDLILSGTALPDAAARTGLMWHTAHRHAVARRCDDRRVRHRRRRVAAGRIAGRTYWLFYRPDLDWMKISGISFIVDEGSRPVKRIAIRMSVDLRCRRKGPGCRIWRHP
jgi:hypothetical protein